MDKGKSLHTKGVEQLKQHLPNSDVVEGKVSKFWPPELVGGAQIASAYPSAPGQ